jgi:hypothetical protein
MYDSFTQGALLDGILSTWRNILAFALSIALTWT